MMYLKFYLLAIMLGRLTTCCEPRCNLEEIRLTYVNPQTQEGKLPLGMVLKAEPQTDGFQITIRLGDKPEHPLFDPGCLDWKVYQLKDRYNIDPTRLFVNSDGEPTMPVPTISYLQSIQASDITFSVDKSHLQHCISKDETSACYFELAFIHNQQTYVSSFFMLKIVDNKPEMLSLMDVKRDFKNLFLDGIIDFCLDQDCNSSTESPLKPMHLNQKIILRLTVPSKLKLVDPVLMIQGSQSKYMLTSQELEIIDDSPGQLVVAVVVPFVDGQATIEFECWTILGQKVKAKQLITHRIEINIAPQNPQHILNRGYQQTSLPDSNESKPVDFQAEELEIEVVPSRTKTTKVSASFSSNGKHSKLQRGDSPNTCDPRSEFLYNGVCLNKDCLSKRLSRVRMTPHLEQPDQTDQTIHFGVKSLGDDHFVTITYGDVEANQIVGDPDKCIDWSVYQISNHYGDEMDRLNLDEGHSSWPIAKYRYIDTYQVGQVQFILSNEDMEKHNCIKKVDKTSTNFECFFEFAFEIQSVTQISYYFSVKIETLNEMANPKMTLYQVILKEITE